MGFIPVGVGVRVPQTAQKAPNTTKDGGTLPCMHDLSRANATGGGWRPP